MKYWKKLCWIKKIFDMARITGWSAHIMEQHAANKLIRPLSKYKGSEHREVLALNIR